MRIFSFSLLDSLLGPKVHKNFSIYICELENTSITINQTAPWDLFQMLDAAMHVHYTYTGLILNAYLSP